MAASNPTWALVPAPEVLTIDGVPSDTRVWVARARRERKTGLLGTDALDGALWIVPCRWIHTFGMRYDLDAVYVDGSGKVIDVGTIGRRRLARPRLGARTTIEMPAGRAVRLGLVPDAVVGRVAA